MPADNPLASETWELTDSSTDTAAQAVITEVSTGGPETAATVRLVNRLGRIITVPRRSFLLTWRFVHPVVSHSCWYANRPEGCARPGVLQLNDEREWVWVCDRHLPVGRQALLPFDQPGDRAAAASEERCPLCNRSLQYPGSGSRASASGSVIHNCGGCGAGWVRLFGRGDEPAGDHLRDQIREAAAALQGRNNIRALVGYRAWASLRSPGGNQPSSFAGGVPIEQHPGARGANNVLVVGDRPATTPRIEIRAREPLHIIRDVNVIAPTPVERQPFSQLTPAIGSLWREFHGQQLVEVTDVSMDFGGEERVTFRFGPSQSDSDTLPVRQFLSRFVIAQRLPTASVLPQPKPFPLGPQAGETWWSHKTGMPVFVLAIKIGENNKQLITYRSANAPEQMVTADVDEFLLEFRIDPSNPACLIGEEWTDDESILIRIHEIRMNRREIVGTNALGHFHIVPLATFVTKFRKVVRRSVYERLLDDEDFGDT